MDGNIELKGKNGTYVMNGGANAMCRLEDLTGKSFGEVLEELQSPAPRMTTIRNFMRATLVDPADATAEQAGAIIDDIGGLAVIADAITGTVTAPAEAPPARKTKSAA